MPFFGVMNLVWTCKGAHDKMISERAHETNGQEALDNFVGS
jgi:hypothetical protein